MRWLCRFQMVDFSRVIDVIATSSCTASVQLTIANKDSMIRPLSELQVGLEAGLQAPTRW